MNIERYKHELKYCPRCGNKFECKLGDIINCQCSNVALTEASSVFLRSTFYDDCLCNKCMIDINQMVSFSEIHPLPQQEELLIKGLHYHYENNLLIFTELYHLQRGYCCKNECKNCAYGFKK